MTEYISVSQKYNFKKKGVPHMAIQEFNFKEQGIIVIPLENRLKLRPKARMKLRDFGSRFQLFSSSIPVYPYFLADILASQ